MPKPYYREGTPWAYGPRCPSCGVNVDAISKETHKRFCKAWTKLKELKARA